MWEKLGEENKYDQNTLYGVPEDTRGTQAKEADGLMAALHFFLLSSKFRPPASPQFCMEPPHGASGVTKNLRLDSSETQWKTKYCCSTKESNNKRTPNDILLYLQISVAIIRASSSAAGGKK